MRDTVLSCREQLEIVPRLQNRAVVCRNVQTEQDPSRVISTDSSRTKQERTSEDIQQRDDVTLCRRIRRASVGGHPNVEATPKNRACDVVLDHIRKMRLIDDCKHVVAAGNPIRDEAGILKHEDMVLRIRNDRGLVLRHLHHGQALKSDDSIRHCRSRPTALSVGFHVVWGQYYIRPRKPLYERAHQLRNGKPG